MPILSDLSDLQNFAKRTGFPVGTIKRVFRPDDGTVSRMIPQVCTPKTVHALAEAGLAEKAREQYYASRGYDPRRGAMRAWISLCATREEILEAYYATEDRSDEERFALKIMNEIFMREINEVPTLEDAMKLCEDTPRESGIERAAFLKLYELHQRG